MQQVRPNNNSSSQLQDSRLYWTPVEDPRWTMARGRTRPERQSRHTSGASPDRSASPQQWLAASSPPPDATGEGKRLPEAFAPTPDGSAAPDRSSRPCSPSVAHAAPSETRSSSRTPRRSGRTPRGHGRGASPLGGGWAGSNSSRRPKFHAAPILARLEADGKPERGSPKFVPGAFRAAAAEIVMRQVRDSKEIEQRDAARDAKLREAAARRKARLNSGRGAQDPTVMQELIVPEEPPSPESPTRHLTPPSRAEALKMANARFEAMEREIEAEIRRKKKEAREAAAAASTRAEAANRFMPPARVPNHEQGTTVPGGGALSSRSSSNKSTPRRSPSSRSTTGTPRVSPSSTKGTPRAERRVHI